MRYKDSWRHQDSNAVNESFWDAQGVEIEACAIFDDFSGSVKNCPYGKQMPYSMLWVMGTLGTLGTVSYTHLTLPTKRIV